MAESASQRRRRGYGVTVAAVARTMAQIADMRPEKRKRAELAEPSTHCVLMSIAPNVRADWNMGPRRINDDGKTAVTSRPSRPT
jgi:hypothetical protein